MDKFEAGREKLEALVRDAETRTTADLNEAETRFFVLDRLVREVLHWPDSSVTLERHHDGDYSDYELGFPEKSVVLEAKRHGKAFDLPEGWSAPSARLVTLMNESTDAREAIKQVAGYCQRRGIPIAVASNGHQLIAFAGSRKDSTAPLDGRAIVFRSLADMMERYSELWKFLSPNGVEARNLEIELGRTPLRPPPAKLSARVSNYPGHKNRNPQAVSLRLLGDLFLEDIGASPEIEDSFLEATYCKSGALSQYALVSKQILRSRYATVFEQEVDAQAYPATTKRGVADELTSEVLMAAMKRRPILLVGDVGSGKTMFIRRLIRVEAKDVLHDAVVLYVDLGTKPAFAENLRNYLSEEIERQLAQEHDIDIRENGFVRGVYHGELRRFEKSIYGPLKESDPSLFRSREIERLEELTADRETHLTESLRHIESAHERRVIIFLDNVDQRPAEFQEEAFLVAQALAEHWPVTVFVALRPETFRTSKLKGTLSAYQTRVFTIEPPRVDRVVVKRLHFARTLLESEGRLPWFPKGFTVQPHSLVSYMTMLEQAFQQNQGLISFVDNFSAGNIRQALDFVGTFIGSGHVDSQKILNIIDSQGSYTLPLHEFVRAVTYGDHIHYDPTTSPIPNVLDVTADDPTEHFLMPILISCVERLGQTGGGDGYVERAEVYFRAQSSGFLPAQIDVALQRLLRLGLLATPSGVPADPTRLRITSRGAYTVKQLLSTFAYLDAIVVDTPIVDVTTRSSVQDAHTVHERLARVENLINYLDTCWDKIAQPPVDIWNWPPLSEIVRKELSRIRERV